jgi:16S rRNA processing protein RimM
LKTIEIGRVVKPHGLSGEVGVKLYLASSGLLEGLDQVTLSVDGNTETRELQSVRRTPKGPLVKLAGIDDRGAAERLRGASVLVPRDLLPEPGPGEYYLHDLIGARVVGPAGPIGEVIDVRVYPSVDCALIRTPDGRSLEQPLAEHWIEEVDLEQGVLRLASEEGLIA